MKAKIKPGDKVLTEEGGVVVLALYDKIFPPKNIVTFDWIDYSGIKDNSGYIQAINDSYFNYIEIDIDEFDNGNVLKEEIMKSLKRGYSLDYKNNNYLVYEKIEK
jgi:hypothetical protein